MLQFRGVVKHLIIINVLMFVGTRALPEAWRIQLALFYPTTDLFQPFQLVSSMFMHADLHHLFMNMLILFFIGPLLEDAIGPQRFLKLYLFAGFGAILLHWGVMWAEINVFGVPPGYETVIERTPVLGASGAVFGVMAAVAMVLPNVVMQLIIPPIPVKMKYLVLFLIAIEIYSVILNRPGDNVAHWAHLGGAIIGAIMILAWGLNQLGKGGGGGGRGGFERWN